MPHLSRSGTIAVVIQESGCPLGAETFFDIFVENDFDNSGFRLIYFQHFRIEIGKMSLEA